MVGILVSKRHIFGRGGRSRSLNGVVTTAIPAQEEVPPRPTSRVGPRVCQDPTPTTDNTPLTYLYETFGSPDLQGFKCCRFLSPITTSVSLLPLMMDSMRVRPPKLRDYRSWGFGSSQYTFRPIYRYSVRVL